MKRPDGAGRKPGSKTKFKLDLAKILEENRIDPAQIIINTLDELEPKDRVNTCLKLMEFFIPKLRAVEHSGEVNTNAPVVQILLPSNGREIQAIDVTEDKPSLPPAKIISE